VDIGVVLKEGAASLHAAETNNNLPGGVAVKYAVKLGAAIKDAVVDATKSKEIKNALNKAKWTFADPVGDSMDMKAPPKDIGGAHTLTFKIGSETLKKKVRCHIAVPKAAEGSDVGGGAGNTTAVKKATEELGKLKAKFPDSVSIKVGDSNHPKNVVYTLTMGKDNVTASIPHPDDTHVKENSRKRALGDWKKNMAEFVKFHKGG
jgi:hypothetical protein